MSASTNLACKSTSSVRAASETTRDRILDAAENSFADKGYAAATMRDIAQGAAVPVSLITHHFGTKEDLFRQVIERRIYEHTSLMNEELVAECRKADGAPIALEPWIRAYVGPLIRKSASGDAGWKNYARLLGLSMNSPQYEQFLRPMIMVYDPIHAKFIKELRRIFPLADERRLYWSIYFLQSAIVHIMVEAGMVDRQSDMVCRSSELEAIMNEMIPFYAAAFEARLRRA